MNLALKISPPKKRKKLKIILLSLLAFLSISSITLYLIKETLWEMLIDIVAVQIGDLLYTEVDLGDIQGDLLNEIVLKDLVIYNEFDPQQPFIKVKEIWVYWNLWELITAESDPLQWIDHIRISYLEIYGNPEMAEFTYFQEESSMSLGRFEIPLELSSSSLYYEDPKFFDQPGNSSIVTDLNGKILLSNNSIEGNQLSFEYDLIGQIMSLIPKVDFLFGDQVKYNFITTTFSTEGAFDGENTNLIGRLKLDSVNNSLLWLKDLVADYSINSEKVIVDVRSNYREEESFFIPATYNPGPTQGTQFSNSLLPEDWISTKPDTMFPMSIEYDFDENVVTLDMDIRYPTSVMKKLYVILLELMKIKPADIITPTGRVYLIIDNGKLKYNGSLNLFSVVEDNDRLYTTLSGDLLSFNAPFVHYISNMLEMEGNLIFNIDQELLSYADLRLRRLSVDNHHLSASRLILRQHTNIRYGGQLYGIYYSNPEWLGSRSLHLPDIAASLQVEEDRVEATGRFLSMAALQFNVIYSTTPIENISLTLQLEDFPLNLVERELNIDQKIANYHLKGTIEANLYPQVLSASRGNVKLEIHDASPDGILTYNGKLRARYLNKELFLDHIAFDPFEFYGEGRFSMEAGMYLPEFRGSIYGTPISLDGMITPMELIKTVQHLNLLNNFYTVPLDKLYLAGANKIHALFLDIILRVDSTPVEISGLTGFSPDKGVWISVKTSEEMMELELIGSVDYQDGTIYPDLLVRLPSSRTFYDEQIHVRGGLRIAQNAIIPDFLIVHTDEGNRIGKRYLLYGDIFFNPAGDTYYPSLQLVSDDDNVVLDAVVWYKNNNFGWEGKLAVNERNYYSKLSLDTKGNYNIDFSLNFDQQQYIVAGYLSFYSDRIQPHLKLIINGNEIQIDGDIQTYENSVHTALQLRYNQEIEVAINGSLQLENHYYYPSFDVAIASNYLSEPLDLTVEGRIIDFDDKYRLELVANGALSIWGEYSPASTRLDVIIDNFYLNLPGIEEPVIVYNEIQFDLNSQGINTRGELLVNRIDTGRDQYAVKLAFSHQSDMLKFPLDVSIEQLDLFRLGNRVLSLSGNLMINTEDGAISANLNSRDNTFSITSARYEWDNNMVSLVADFNNLNINPLSDQLRGMVTGRVQLSGDPGNPNFRFHNFEIAQGNIIYYDERNHRHQINLDAFVSASRFDDVINIDEAIVNYNDQRFIARKLRYQSGNPALELDELFKEVAENSQIKAELVSATLDDYRLIFRNIAFNNANQPVIFENLYKNLDVNGLLTFEEGKITKGINELNIQDFRLNFVPNWEISFASNFKYQTIQIDEEGDTYNVKNYRGNFSCEGFRENNRGELNLSFGNLNIGGQIIQAENLFFIMANDNWILASNDWGLRASLIFVGTSSIKFDFGYSRDVSGMEIMRYTTQSSILAASDEEVSIIGQFDIGSDLTNSYIDAKVNARLYNLDIFTALPINLYDLDGKLSVDLQIKGSPNNPTITGTTTLNDGQITLEDLNFSFEDIYIFLSFEPNQITLVHSQTKYQDAWIQANGNARYNNWNITGWRVNVTTYEEGIPLDLDFGYLTFRGKLKGSIEAYNEGTAIHVSGNLVPYYGIMSYLLLGGASERREKIPDVFRSVVIDDLTIYAGDDLYFSVDVEASLFGPELGAEFPFSVSSILLRAHDDASGDMEDLIKINGRPYHSRSLNIQGMFRSLQGTVDLFWNTFNIQLLQIVFQGSEEPLITIMADTRKPDITQTVSFGRGNYQTNIRIILNFSGTLSKFLSEELFNHLQSVPSRPPETIAQILGVGEQQITRELGEEEATASNVGLARAFEVAQQYLLFSPLENKIREYTFGFINSVRLYTDVFQEMIFAEDQRAEESLIRDTERIYADVDVSGPITNRIYYSTGLEVTGPRGTDIIGTEFKGGLDIDLTPSSIQENTSLFLNLEGAYNTIDQSTYQPGGKLEGRVELNFNYHF